MKILFMASGSNPKTLGGIQTFGRMLKKFFPEDLEFVCYSKNEKYYFKVNDVNEININLIFRVINKILNNKLKNYCLKKYISKLKPEICILNDPKELYSLNDDIKKILVQHRNYNAYISSYCKNNLKLIEDLKNKIDFFIFLSEFDQKKFIKELRFPIEKTMVIRHCSEIPLLKKQKQKNKNLVMISRIINNPKRFDLVINSMIKLPDFILNIYGEGPDISKIKKLIIKNNLKNVFLKGSTTKILETLDENGIYVMTSDNEGYGISNIEAMRRGLPIILRNTFEAAQDIVKDNGVLLDSEWSEEEFVRGVRQIYHNYEFYSKNSINLAQRYDFNKIKKQWEFLINKLS